MKKENDNNDIPVITIDGPSGVGKSIISKIVASFLHWNILNSGLIYRAFALIVERKGIPLDNIILLLKASETVNISFKNDIYKKTQMVILDELEDITTIIKSEKYANIASIISSYKEIRLSLVNLQRSFRRYPGLVAEGRDMGTIIFPYAKNKFFLTANIEERCKRRLLQLQDQGIDANLNFVFKALVERDERDSKRITSPLKPDTAAMIIDTTKLSFNEVVQQILAHVKNMSI